MPAGTGKGDLEMKKITIISGLLAAVLLGALPAFAQDAEVRLDTAPVRTDPLELQSGARTFVNYCLTCHGASAMRYNRLRDLGLSEAEIKDNLILTDAKVGETMKVALTTKDGKQFFGTAPPDLSLIARSRGADWLYTYLRSFYRDPSRPTGWNNTVFPNVGMPHVLYALQGEQVLKAVEPAAKAGEEKTGEAGEKKAGEHETEAPKMVLQLAKPGSLTPVEYDVAVADLVGFLVYVGEPGAAQRKHMGYFVLFGLFVLTALAYALKREFWKDVH
jgi:ubiquinol-cytochrome c reductase cytochrome c1 subunit